MRTGVHQCRHQQGQSMVEFVIVWPVLAFLTLGTFQLALIYLAKSTLNYATFEATRAGSLNYAKRINVEYGFSRGMAPLYTTKIRSVNNARKKVMRDISNNHVCIERINPRQADFDAYALTSGEIPNDNLMYRSPAEDSGLSIQDANLLKLRITYCYKMIVPLIDRFISSALSSGAGSFQKACLAERRIPIVAQGLLRMQTAAINDSTFDTSCD